MSPFVYVWEYRARPQAAASFAAAYGSGGDWVRLFRRHPGYLGTMLLRDLEDPLRFCTIDSWRSRADHNEFRSQFAADFETLDARCAALTEVETHLGDFEDVSR